ncbi:MAG: DegT/DnrJ/EryC1/StrS family aminotransferase [Actinomycetota bacterium]
MSRIWLSHPDVGPAEREALLRAFDSGWIAPTGPEVDAFEHDMTALTGWPGAVAVASGTAGLHVALKELGVGSGDTVLVSSFTFVATANAVTYCGARPVFVDSDRTSWNMSPDLVAGALDDLARQGSAPKAVVMVDLYGQCADADAIAEICWSRGIPLVEDAAEALGARYKGRPAGTLGNVGVFSFNGNKIITTSGGGMVVAPSAQVTDRLRFLATQAREPEVHYEHRENGYNYRLSNLLAAVGRAQLARLPSMMSRRRAINAAYREAFRAHDAITFMPHPSWSEWNGWLSCVLFDDGAQRDRVMQTLAEDDIESRPLWKPLHLQPVFASAQSYVDGTSEDLFRRGLCLPSSSALTDGDVARVIDRVTAALV